MKLISIDYFSGVFAYWLESEDHYIQCSWTPQDKEPEEVQRIPKAEYRSWSHFWQVWGKFDPETLFLIKKVTIPEEKVSIEFLHEQWKKLHPR